MNTSNTVIGVAVDPTHENSSSSSVPAQFKQTQIALSLMTAQAGKTIAKGYTLDEAGCLQKNDAATFSFGTYKTVFLTDFAQEFTALLQRCTTSNALLYAICRDLPEGRIVPDAMLKADSEKETSRTKENFQHPEGACIIVVDVDAPTDQPALSREQACEALVTAAPALKTTAMVWSVSSSSYLFNEKTNAPIHGLRGQRFYFVINSGTDARRVYEVLHARSCINGHLRFEISVAGVLLERSLVDLAMANVTQPDYVGGSVCSGGVIQMRPAPEVLWEGPPLDPALAFPDLTSDEKALLEALRLVKRAEKQEAANKQRAIWKAERAELLAEEILKSKGITNPDKSVKNAARIKAAQIVDFAAETRVLKEDFQILLDDGTSVTVREILADPEKFNGRLTYDPLEPGYGGHRVVGKIYLKSGTGRLHSLAHGGQTFQLVLDKPSTRTGKGAGTGKVKYPLTDLGNARHFVKMFQADVRYCPTFKSFFTWQNGTWLQDTDGAAMRLAKEFADHKLHSAGKKEVSHALTTQSSARLNALLDLVKSEPGIPVASDLLDADPWLFAVKNGVIDLRTGNLRDSRREDLLTKQSPIEFDPNAQCPLFLEFLTRIMQDNEEMVSFLQRFVGYTLTGLTREQALALCYGTGANGKSTLFKALSGIMGPHGIACSFDMLMIKKNGGGIPNDIARLRGARYVSASEAEEGARLAESLVKQLTGEDTISARFLFGEFFDFVPSFKLWLACNHKPTLRGDDPAVWRRLLLIPFNAFIPPAERDKDLNIKLCAEYPGILAWAVRGCLAWQENGLQAPDMVRVATEEYKAELDWIGRWLDECCLQGGVRSAQAAELYQSYRDWVERNGGIALSSTRFGIKLTERGFTKTKNGVIKYCGLELV